LAHLDAKAIAAALGGFRCGVGFLARCPSHDDREPSLSLRDLSGKVLVHCFGGCPQEEVLEALQARRLWSGAEKPGNLKPLERPSPSRWDTPESERVARALQHWGEAEDPRRTLAEQYLASRKLALEDDLSGRVLRFHRECPFGKDEAGSLVRRPCLLALFRDTHNDSPRAILRVALNGKAEKIGRKMYGPVGGTVIKLSADEDSTHGLHLAEGLETALAAMQRHAWRPMWCTGSADALKTFRLLAGIECLTLAADHDAPGLTAAQACAERWAKAKREVFIRWPAGLGQDFAD
jgi:hypothetical protein